MRNLKKKYIGEICLCYILLQKICCVCNILTFSKAFDSIPDFENLGYQIEIVKQF